MIRRAGRTNAGIDALLPAEIAEKAETIGVQKTNLDVLSLTALAVLAGAFIALGAMFATTVLAGADGVLPYGLSWRGVLSGTDTCHRWGSRIVHRERPDGHGVGCRQSPTARDVAGLAHRLHRQFHRCGRDCDTRVLVGAVPERARCRRQRCAQARTRQGDRALRSRSLSWHSM